MPEEHDEVSDWQWETYPEGHPRSEASLLAALGERVRYSAVCSPEPSPACGWIEPPPGNPWLPGELEKKLEFEERARRLGLRFRKA